MGLKNTEVEFKYSAKDIKLSDFKEFCLNRKPDKFLLISGWDHFFSKSSEPGSFYRHRVNTNENQLTFKRKTDNDNNFIREEHNIDLPVTVSEDKIKDLCNITGYVYDASIFKNCFIYNFEYYTFVYYIVYNTELAEVGRFIEIEMKEDYDWNTEEEAYGELLTLEKLCRTLGISPEKRVKESLFEMFRRKE